MFKNARIKLTAWYLAMIMIVSVSFSFVIYRALIREFEKFAYRQRFRMEQKFYGKDGLPSEFKKRLFLPPDLEPELLKETKNKLQITLFVINTCILALSGVIGYFLAEKTLKPIQTMVEEQNRFITDASHELKTPLTSLKTVMEVSLLDKKLTLEEAKKVMRENIGEVNRLQTLSEGLLQLAQYEKQYGNFTFEKLELSKIIQDAIKKISPLAKEKKINIVYEKKVYMIMGDKFGLTDLFVVLLDNAVKYSPSGNKVKVKTEPHGNSITVIVTDNGIGIDKIDMSHIFDRFYRANTARTKFGAGGYGLGLAIAKKIVSSHHGLISVTSTPAKGTAFSVSLPVKS